MGEILREFDWVKALAACSIGQVFKELQMGVEGDIEAINSVRGLQPDTAFRTYSDRPAMFIVFQNSGPRVKFSCGEDRIEIADEVAGQNIVATLTLTDEWRCKLKVGQEELEQWQVRRRALEALLFVPVSTR